jgi:monovalent cation:H+ antiporter-2, CPA2 family
MVHLPELIHDLGLILIAAAVVTLAFKRLKQPVVLGYIVAGVLVGPHFHLFPTVTEHESVKVWAEIGVIFLLFGLGLEFSFKKLASVGRSASITAVFEIVFMLTAGYLLGRGLGWSSMDSIFLGGVLSISSTTIIVRAFEELGLKGRQFVTLVFGALIVEDLVAILLLLSSVAVAQSVSGMELLTASLRLMFFMILWFVVGVYVLPILMRRLQRYLSNETTLIISVGLCLGMVIVATKAGFSPALGAFVMGSLLAETREGERIEHLLVPVRDLFAAIFFVSVGMLIDLKALAENAGPILLITLVTILGKTFSTTLGSLLSGQNLRRSIQSGMSLAQIGEFSFIIATLGLTLKVTSDFLYPIAVAVSAITTFTTPYMIKVSDPFCRWVEGRLPKSVASALASYQAAMNAPKKPGLTALLWRSFGVKVLLNGVVVAAIGLTGRKIVGPMLATGDWPDFAPGVAGAIALVISIPFLWGVTFGRPTPSAVETPADAERLKRMQFGIVVLRLLAGFTLAAFVSSQFLSFGWTSFSVVVLTFGLGVFARKFSSGLYEGIEQKFLENLNDKERDTKSRPELAPWDATLTQMKMSPDSALVMHSLAESRLKENFGVTVALIERGSRQIVAPGRDTRLLPFDQIYMIGNEEQLASARKMIETPVPFVRDAGQIRPEDYALESILLDEQSRFNGKPIRESGLRETIHGLIIGIEREGKRILSPDSSLVLGEGDLLWVVGDRAKIRALVKEPDGPHAGPPGST